MAALNVDTLVIGAGQAGLAAGYHLRRAGTDFSILEAGEGPGTSWAGYYESLTLFSPARHSELPGLRFPGDPQRYPTRDEVVAYLRAYAHRWDLPVIPGQRVTSIECSDGSHFVAQTAAGTIVQARRVLNTTGSYGSPFTPAIPGLAEFRGRILHSRDYKAPFEYAGQRVVVVGGGNSAVQIAVELAAESRVSLATRAPVRFMPQRPGGVDLHDWLTRTGVDRLPAWAWPGGGGSVPVLDDGTYRAALTAGRPDRQPMFRRFTEDAVHWADGRHEKVDVVLFATGFTSASPHLAGIPGALRGNDAPRHRHGLSPVPQLGYAGLEWQRSFSSATLRGVGRDTAYVLRKLGATGR